MGEVKNQLTRAKAESKRVAAVVAERDAAVAALRIEHEGALLDLKQMGEAALLECERVAKKQFNIAIAAKERMIANRDAKLLLARAREQELLDVESRCAAAEQIAWTVPSLERRVEEAEQVGVERLLTIKRLCGKLGGRPQLSRTDASLESCEANVASHAQRSMTARILSVIGEVDTDTEISTVAVMDALQAGGYMAKVWESEQMWCLRMSWAGELRENLSLSWDANLTMKIRDKLVVSYDKVDELRFMLSHNRVGKQLRPRVWFINPWDGRRLNFPQPIRPRSGALGWTRLVSAAQKCYGLSMDKQGKIAQRSFADTVALQFRRDEARGLLRPSTDEDPLVCVLGADGTGVGKRSMMHVASSLAPSYNAGVSVENERNISTVAASVTDDHWAGLNETLCGGCHTGEEATLPPNSIAGEINALIASKRLTVPSPDGIEPAREVPVRPAGCFDLVAARGIRGGNGRCACHTATPTADRFNVPDVDDETTWEAALEMLNEVPTLEAAEMRDDSHTPPEDWDFSLAPWQCGKCPVEFASRAQFLAERKAFFAARRIRREKERKSLPLAPSYMQSRIHRNKVSFSPHARTST